MDGGDRVVKSLRSGASYELALGAVGDQTVYGDSLLSEPITFETVPLPRLATPENLVYSERMLEWDVVPNAMGYELVITPVAGDRGPFKYQTEISSFVFDDHPENYPGYFRATVVALGDNITTADSYRAFIEAYLWEKPMAEQLTTPASLMWISETKTLSWGAVDNAKSYSVSYQKGETDELFATTPALYIVISDTLEPGAYSFKVKANGDGDNYTDSDWTDYVEVKIQEPTPTPPAPVQLTAPTNLTWTSETSTLGWDAVENANGYSIYYEKDQSSELFVTTNDTFVVIKDSLPSGTYSFKVKANGDGTSYTDSELTEAVPVILSGSSSSDDPDPTPQDPESLAAPGGLKWDKETWTFSWDAVENASGYSVSFSKGEGDEQIYTTTETMFNTGELTAGKYLIAVESTGDNVNYTNSVWSSVFEIVIEDTTPGTDPDPGTDPETPPSPPTPPAITTFTELGESYGFGYLTPQPAIVGWI